MVVMLVVFIVSPKEIPKVLRKVGEVLGFLERLKNEIFSIKKEMTDIVDEVKGKEKKEERSKSKE